MQRGSPVLKLTGKAEPYWIATLAGEVPNFPPLDGNLAVDVAIIGGGIVGLTAAELLARAGKRIALIEARKVGQQVTGRSTAKVTSQHGLIYQRLAKDFGEEAARLYGAANQAGLEQIARFARDGEIDCEFERTAAYVYASSDAQLAEIEREVEVAKKLGLPASLVRDVPLPFATAGAIRFDDQAQFNPFKYSLGLAKAIAGAGGLVLEGIRARSVELGKPCRVATDRGTIMARDVIDASHMPLGKEGMFFAKAYPYAHAVIAARIDPARAPQGMFISAGSPTRSVRPARRNGETYLIATGGAYKSGETDHAIEAFDDLRRFVQDEFGVQSIDYYWTNQDYESMDGMPFIGRASSGAEHLFVAIGFNAWGLTTGTAAGMILADLIMDRTNPWAAIFDATRVKPVKAAPSFVRENVGTGVHLVGGYLASRPRTIDHLAPGEAAVLNMRGERVAVFKDEHGEIHAVSAVCTHLYCTLGWNPADRTWDCSCHGSRFAVDGSVLHGPATASLQPKSVSRA
jgi:glycine/D-amino acid oxidase-like deaminating enzyme/nitrite reductase/ring-hydroxylating ferredoxin subunit